MTKLYFIMFLLIPFMVFSATPSRKNLRFFKTLGELVQTIVMHNDSTKNPDEKIDSFGSYRRNHKILINAPANPVEYYKEELTGWPDFLERLNISFFKNPLELKKAIVFYNMMNPDKPIIDPETYLEYYTFLNRAPHNPRKYYKKAWKGWEYVLGQKKKVYIKELSTLKEKVQEHNIKYPLRKITSSSTYGRYYKDIDGAPAKPQKFYKDWVNWDEFLDKKKLSFEEFIEAIIEHNVLHPDKLIDSGKTYKEYHYLIPGAPTNPARTYKGEWKGWNFVSEQCEQAFQEVS